MEFPVLYPLLFLVHVYLLSSNSALDRFCSGVWAITHLVSLKPGPCVQGTTKLINQAEVH